MSTKFIVIDKQKQFTNWIQPPISELRKEYHIEWELKDGIKSQFGNELFKDFEEFYKHYTNAKIITISKEFDKQIYYRTRFYLEKDKNKAINNLFSLIRTYKSYPEYRNETTFQNLIDRIIKNEALFYPIIILAIG